MIGLGAARCLRSGRSRFHIQPYRQLPANVKEKTMDLYSCICPSCGAAGPKSVKGRALLPSGGRLRLSCACGEGFTVAVGTSGPVEYRFSCEGFAKTAFRRLVESHHRAWVLAGAAGAPWVFRIGWRDLLKRPLGQNRLPYLQISGN